MRPAIVTEPLRPEHAQVLFEPLSDAALYHYIPGPPPVSCEALAAEFRRLAAGSRDGSQTWLNWVSFHENAPVGTLQATILPDRSAIIAYVVLRPFWGRSLGSQGCRWLLRELFEKHRVTEVVACVDERNKPSLRLLAAVGLSLRPAKATSDVEPGEVLFGLSAKDWRAQRDEA